MLSGGNIAHVAFSGADASDFDGMGMIFHEGYGITENFGIQPGYMTTGGSDSAMEIASLAMSAAVRFQVSDRLNILGEAGLFMWEVDLTAWGVTASIDDNDFH